MATTAASRDRSGSRQQLKSPPLKRPPMITTSPAIEALDGAPGRLDVRRLGVVHEPHAVDRGDRLQRVLEAGERFDRAYHRVGGDAGEPRHRRRGHHVGDRWRPISRIDDNGTSGVSCPARVSAMAPTLMVMPSVTVPSSEKSRRPARAPCARRHVCGSSALITAQSFSVWFAKILAFAVRVLLERGMPIQMVWRQVQQDRNPRMERLDGLQLKTAHLDDVERLRRGVGHLGAERRADVPADHRPFIRRP